MLKRCAACLNESLKGVLLGPYKNPRKIEKQSIPTRDG